MLPTAAQAARPRGPRRARAAARVLIMAGVTGLLGSPPALLRAAPPPATAPAPPAIQVDVAARRLSFAGRVARQFVFAELDGAIEYVAVCPGGKEYEALFICDLKPAELREALTKIGAVPGRPAGEQDGKAVAPTGSALRLSIRWDAQGKARQEPVEHFVNDAIEGKPMAVGHWVFTGSRIVRGPDNDQPVLEAALIKNLVSLHQLDPGVLVQNAARGASDSGRYKASMDRLPPEGTAVTLVFEPVPAQRLHALVQGRVQGVGFRDFTQSRARALQLRGWARNLPSGEVEVLAEGPADALDQLRQELRKGPRAARVDAVKELRPASTEAVGEFEVRPTPTGNPTDAGK